MALQTYSLIISYNSGGQFAQNILHYQFDDAGFTTTKSAAEALQTAWNNTGPRAALITILPAAVTIVSLRGGRVSSPGGFDAFSPLSGGNVGLRGAAMSASGLAPCLIHYPVNLTQGRGRTFLPGVAEADIEDGIFTTGFRGAVLSALSTLFDPITLTGGGGPTATFGYFSRKGTPHFVALANTILSENLGTQRRRMRPA
jgi:hypothetical protein